MTNIAKQLTCLLCSVIATAMFLLSCTDVDKQLGTGMIPNDQQQKIMIDTIYPDAFTVTLDSMYTKGSALMVGSTADPVFGLTSVGLAFQLLPTKDTVSFGSSPTPTSLKLQLVLNNTPIGSKTAPQTIEVYELKERIYYDSAYYCSTPIATMIESVPVVTHTYNGEDTLTINLGATLATKLLNAPAEAMMRDTATKAKFFDYFKGFYIVGNSASGSERINHFTASPKMTLTYSNTEKTDTTCVYQLLSGTTHFTVFNHDYTQANPAMQINHLNDTTATGIDSVIYLQGLYGAAPYINIRAKLLNDWLQAKGLAVSQAAVIRAELVMEVEDVGGYNIASYPNEVGGITLQNPIVAFNIAYNSSVHIDGCLPSLYQSKTIFDGSLNRTKRTYSCNITQDVISQLQSNKDLKFYLIPYSEQTLGSYPNQRIIYTSPTQQKLYNAFFKGPSNSRPLKLIITYSQPI